MQQLSIKLNTPNASVKAETSVPNSKSWFAVARQWFGAVLHEQRAIDEQVTAPLLRRYRHEKSRQVVE